MNKHVIESQQFDEEFLIALFQRVGKIKMLMETREGKLHLSSLCTGRTLINFFYEESTRTRVSFAIAAQMLGMTVSETTNAGVFSSVVKGESFEHTIRVLCGYQPDVIVLRHMHEGAAQKAADISDRVGNGVPFVNAGDGHGQHPTQAITDLFTIHNELGSRTHLNVAVVGDLRFGRTTHSLVYLLTQCPSMYPNLSFSFVAPKELQMKQGILHHLEERKVPWSMSEKLDEQTLVRADVVYMTRTQWERLFSEYTGPKRLLYQWFGGIVKPMERYRLEKKSPQCKLTLERAQMVRSDSIIMHPMPIRAEIESVVDKLPNASYFRQAANGLPVRMALLLHVIDG